MPNKAVFRISRPSVWSHNTPYVSLSGVHSENSPQTLARCNHAENQYNNALLVMENMYKKDMQNLDRSKRQMEQSMLAYSEKMSQIKEKRNSMPVSPSLQLTKYWSVGSKYDINSSISSDKTTDLSENVLNRHSTNATTDFPTRQLSPIVLRSNNRKMTYHGREDHFIDVNTVIRPRVHSVSISNPSKTTEEKRQRKAPVTLPPSPESYRKLRENRDSVDSAYGSHEFSGDELDSDENSVHGTYTTNTSVQISPFPDIIEEPPPEKRIIDDKKYINKLMAKNKKPNKESRKIRKSVGDFPEGHQSSRLLPLRKSPVNTSRKFSHPGPRKQSIVLDMKKVEEKKGPGVCQSFRYSSAVEELLKSPNPFSVSKNETVSKVEKGPDGRMIATLGAGVLTVIDIDDMENVRGMKMNLKRHSVSNFSESKGYVSRDHLGISTATLPTIENKGSSDSSVIAHSMEHNLHSVSKQSVSDSKSNIFLESFREAPLPNLLQQSASTLTIVSVEG